MEVAWDILADGGVLAHHPYRHFDAGKYPNKFSYTIFGDFNAPHLTELGESFMKALPELLEQGHIKVSVSFCMVSLLGYMLTTYSAYRN